ncbi:hypothetical protein F4780DRAFT_793779 [Xylariomycetidae sp. FL0641]|nr:hypothetical protein F4780DRAFT_793779 [Xylariomycetidae sp. FL0641]
MSTTDRVEVKPSGIRGAGRGLFARRDLQPGEVVVSLERPLVGELETERLLDTCGWCFQRGATDPLERQQAAAMGLPNGLLDIKGCTGCRRVGYCSKACQARAWKREHKYECKVLAPKDRPDLPRQVRGAVKLLGRLAANPDADSSREILDILNFQPAGDDHAVDRIRALDKQRYGDFELLGTAAWHYCDKPTLKIGDAETVAKRLVANVTCNTYRISSPLDDAELGTGFDPIICSANHSCDPNVVLVCNQPRMLLRALRPIKKGDEIFLKYTETTNPYGVRQAQLRDIYRFECHCSKCAKGPHLAEDAFAQPPEKLTAQYRAIGDELLKRYKKELPKHSVPMEDTETQQRLAAIQAEAFAVADNAAASIDDVREMLQVCVHSGMWAWTRQPVPQLTRKLFSQYLEAGEVYKAFRAGLKLYFVMNPKLHEQKWYPDSLIDTWVLSTIANVLCGPMFEGVFRELAEAGFELRVVYFGFLFHVHDHMAHMYGFDSPFGRVVKNTYDQLMAGVPYSKDLIQQKVDAVWPKLEFMAAEIDVLSL